MQSQKATPLLTRVRRLGRRPGHPPLLEWSSVMKECVDVLDNHLHEDLTNVILHYLVEVPQGRFVQQFGSKGELQNPHGVTVWKDVVFVADSDNHRICVYRLQDGEFVRSFNSEGGGDGQLDYPYGLVVCVAERGVAGNGDDLLFVTECWNHRVSVFRASDGSFVRRWGSEGNGDGQFSCPNGLAVDEGLQRVYVADCYNDRIQVFTLDGSFIQHIGSDGCGIGKLSNPDGVAVHQGMLFVTDSANDRISVFDQADGSFIKHIGSRGELKSPCGVACGDGWW